MSTNNLLATYLAEFDTYRGGAIYYDFGLKCGGLADCLKFFAHVLHKCIDQKLRLFYILNDIPIEKYVRVKHPKIRISRTQIQNNNPPLMFFPDANSAFYGATNGGHNVAVNPFMFYAEFDSDRLDTIPFHEIFEFSPVVVERAASIFGLYGKDPYVAMHLRLGDKFLETDRRFVACANDRRVFQQPEIMRVLRELVGANIPVLFLCDNGRFRASMKAAVPEIYITEGKIGHTSFVNTTDEQVLDTVVEFYLMTQAERIVAASYSGFSLIAAKFNGIQIEKIYTE